MSKIFDALKKAKNDQVEKLFRRLKRIARCVHKIFTLQPKSRTE